MNAKDKTSLVEDGMLTIDESETHSGLGRTTLYEAMKAGHLRYAKFGKARRIPKRALLDFLAASLVG